MNQHLFSKEAAEYLRICTDTLMAEQAAGRLIGFKIGGRWRFDVRDLDQYIEDKRRDAHMKAASVASPGNKKPMRTSQQPSNVRWYPGFKIEEACAK